jgi:hypothetical protein
MNPTALADFIKARRDVLFEWGQSDCTLFALAAYDAAHGTDFAGPHIGQYKTERGAKGRLDRAGGFLVALRNMGFERISRNFAQRGDLCIVPGPALAICLGHTVAGQGKDGIEYLPRSAVVTACRRS